MRSCSEYLRKAAHTAIGPYHLGQRFYYTSIAAVVGSYNTTYITIVSCITLIYVHHLIRRSAEVYDNQYIKWPEHATNILLLRPYKFELVRQIGTQIVAFGPLYGGGITKLFATKLNQSRFANYLLSGYGDWIDSYLGMCLEVLRWGDP